MPVRRKEVRYFDHYFARGLGWYKAFFPPAGDTGKYRAIGEISPQYYKCKECPKRIYRTLPNSKLLIMLRHPVSRAYSVYSFHVQRRNFGGTFKEFLANRPEILEQGFYSRYLERYLHYFDRAQVLPLVFEEAITNTNRTKAIIADFLDVDQARFPALAGRQKVNASTVPKCRYLYGFASNIGRRLNSWRLDSFVDCVRRLKVERLLAIGRPMSHLDKKLKERLSRPYHQEFERLEQSLDLNLSHWRKQESDSGKSSTGNPHTREGEREYV